MFPAVSLLTTLILALSIAASSVETRDSPISLPTARRLSTSGGTINHFQHNQSSAAALKTFGGNTFDRHTDIIAVTNHAVSYIAAFGVGSPATTYELIIDTGSSNTWVGANTSYVKTNTSVNTDQSVKFTYDSGFFSGTEYTDTITLGSGLTITNQSIGVASTSKGFCGYDGILGIGPVDMTNGTLKNSTTTTIPAVTKNLYSQGTIPQEVVSVSFEPTTTRSYTNGELIFGGTNATKYNGTIAYTPLTKTHRASYYWGINGSITYETTRILAETAGIVDTDATLILIASGAYSKHQSATNATLDQTTGLLRINSTQHSALENPNFNIGNTTYALTLNGQIWSRALDTYLGGSHSYI